MFRTTTLCVGLMLTLVLDARAARGGKDFTVNLKFIPQEEVSSESPDLPSAMPERSYELRIEDGRSPTGALVIGSGTNDDDDEFSIHAGSDVIAYAKETLRRVSAEWGLKTAEPSERILTVKVARFFVEESNKPVGSMYASEVNLSWNLADASGARLAEGAGSGSAQRYGRSRSADNCNEVLSDALKEAFNAVLSSHNLQTAWTSGKPPGGGAAVSDDKGSIEERLRKLDDLLQKGLITKDEYDAKRAEILKGI